MKATATVFFLCGVLLTSPTVHGAAGPTLVLAFEGTAVTLQGSSPSGEVVWFSVASESSGYASTTVPRHKIDLADASGAAQFELESAVPAHSIWAAVDMTTGEFNVATPGDYPLRRVALPSGAVTRDLLGKVSLLTRARTDLHLLVVRPGLGAWVGRASEGAPDDADGASDGVLTAALSNLRALGSSPPVPEEFANGDVLVAIDPIRMDVSAVRLAN